jgi:hypothetical protein
MVGVLWAAGKPQRFTLTAMPKGIGFRVKESSADGAGGGIVFPDVFKHGGMLDVFREGDSMFAALPLQNDIFGELHTTSRVSPWNHFDVAIWIEIAYLNPVVAQIYI